MSQYAGTKVSKTLGTRISSLDSSPEAVASWQEMKSEYEARMNKEREDTRVRYERLNLLVYAA